MSPFGHIWLEWSLGDDTTKWGDATRYELALAIKLISDGWILYKQSLEKATEPVRVLPLGHTNTMPQDSQVRDHEGGKKTQRGRVCSRLSSIPEETESNMSLISTHSSRSTDHTAHPQLNNLGLGEFQINDRDIRHKPSSSVEVTSISSHVPLHNLRMIWK